MSSPKQIFKTAQVPLAGAWWWRAVAKAGGSVPDYAVNLLADDRRHSEERLRFERENTIHRILEADRRADLARGHAHNFVSAKLRPKEFHPSHQSGGPFELVT